MHQPMFASHAWANCACALEQSNDDFLASIEREKETEKKQFACLVVACFLSEAKKKKKQEAKANSAQSQAKNFAAEKKLDG